ncbi:hypothetical protein AVEN_25889-1 [Araneus ventricosus]|uniref:Uncharacterized protein n=1 Tax=Araneus ventricosus TaxID=182803 RepID=A0A4Y2F9U8_ARAVE|nr:hypothetical protein AVEN_25889-1 [Araneus ventricosus]
MKAPDLYPSTRVSLSLRRCLRRRVKRSNRNMPRRVLKLMVRRFLVYSELNAGQPSNSLFFAFHAPITPMFHRRKWAVGNNFTPRNYSRWKIYEHGHVQSLYRKPLFKTFVVYRDGLDDFRVAGYLMPGT